MLKLKQDRNYVYMNIVYTVILVFAVIFAK
jgi:hypothetical protein